MLVFNLDLRIAGIDYKAGDKVPDDIRDGVLQPLKRLGRVSESEPDHPAEPEKPKRGRPPKAKSSGDKPEQSEKDIFKETE